MKYVVRKESDCFYFDKLTQIANFIGIKKNKSFEVEELIETGEEYNGYTVDEAFEFEQISEKKKDNFSKKKSSKFESNQDKEIERLNKEIDEIMQGWRIEREYFKKQIAKLKQQLKTMTEWIVND